jgi:hypothetical protein
MTYTLVVTLMGGLALCLTLPSPAHAQFDFADALAVKIRTYPVKRSDGKPVPGPDGMPQPEATSGGKPAKLKEFPDFPIDENFPGGSILASLQFYQKLDPLGAFEPVLAVLHNGYLEMDIEKPCRVDLVKIQFEQKPTEDVPSFREHGIVALMKIIADGAMAADLLRTHNDLRDRYNSGLSTTPKADQDEMAGLRTLRQLIALWYNPRVVSLAFKGLPPQDAKERFKAEVSKGQPLEADLVMGPLRLAMKGKVEQRTKSPAPAGCPGAKADSGGPALNRHAERMRAIKAIIRKVSLPYREGNLYEESLKAELTPNGKGTTNGQALDGRSQNGAVSTNGRPSNGGGQGRIRLVLSEQQVNLKSRILTASYKSALKFSFYDKNGDGVTMGYANFFGRAGKQHLANVQEDWKGNRDKGLPFGYDPDGQEYNFVYNIGQGDEGGQQAAQPTGLIDPWLQGADIAIKGTIDSLIQIYEKSDEYNLTQKQIEDIARTIYELTRIRHAWGTETAENVSKWADNVFIRIQLRKGLTPDAARKALDRLKSFGMNVEQLIAQEFETSKEEEQYVRDEIRKGGASQQQQDQYVTTYFGEPVVQTVSLVSAQMTGSHLYQIHAIDRVDLANFVFVWEFRELIYDLVVGDIGIYQALAETTSLIEDYNDYLHGGTQQVYVRRWIDEYGDVQFGFSGGWVSGEYGVGTYSWATPTPLSLIGGSTGQVAHKGIWNVEPIVITGPCIKGPGTVIADDAEEKFYVGVKYRFSSPRHIGFSVVNYLYGEETSELGGLSSCKDRSLREEVDTSWFNDITPNDPHFASKGSWGQKYDDQWALQRIGFTALEDKASAWHLTTGTERPVVVAVIDTGIDLTHPDVHIDNIWVNEKEIPGNLRDDDGNGYIDDLIGWNFVHNHNNPFDVVGHGTHVAGLIAARWDNGRGIAGMNRGVRIMALRAFNGIGRGWGSDVARAIIYAANNGAQIINISASHEGHTKFMEYALNYARQKGVLVVVSAGNKGKDTKGSEASNQPGTLAVAATLPNDKRAPFSNWGQEVDVAAPGVDVLSLRATNTDLIPSMAETPEKVEPGVAIVGIDQRYYRAGGTSFAAPLVSGLASLIWAKNPKLKAEQVARMIRQSAQDIEVPGWDQFTGYGLVDARAALTANPDWHLVAKIHGLQGAEEAGGPVVHVLGTVEGSSLAGYQVQVGEGKEPKEWRTVSKQPPKEVSGGKVATLKPSDFGGPGTWTVRIVARDKKGRTRESRGVLNLK